MPETISFAVPDPLLAVALLIAAGMVVIIVMLAWPKRPQTDPAAQQRISDLTAQVQAMGQLLAGGQAQLQQAVHQRLDAVTQNLGESMKTTTKNTADHLQQLHARLAVIDSAQKNITELAAQVNSLQGILSNKQTRGAFGQGQLEAIIADVLPKGAYEFQYTLSSRLRPDCVIFLPDGNPLVIDAKFPLEAMTAFTGAANEEERRQAIARVRQDIGKHIGDVARYMIPGETQDIALMFIPSESVYAELHERFDDVVQRAQRARVMIVSPTLLVMAVQVIQQVQKDARMREAADLIRTEVGQLLKDVRLLGERARKLQTHFGQASDDIGNMLISVGKIEKRSARIEDLEFEGDPSAETLPAPVRRLGAAE